MKKRKKVLIILMLLVIILCILVGITYYTFNVYRVYSQEVQMMDGGSSNSTYFKIDFLNNKITMYNIYNNKEIGTREYVKTTKTVVAIDNEKELRKTLNKAFNISKADNKGTGDRILDNYGKIIKRGFISKKVYNIDIQKEISDNIYKHYFEKK